MKFHNQRWPAELRTPIIIEEIRKAIPPQRRLKDVEIETLNAIWEERYRRAEIIGDFLGKNLPRTDDIDNEWLRLLVAICRHWKIPAFQTEMTKPRGPGAVKIWTDDKHCELFADVQHLVMTSRLSEYGACKFIAANPKKYGQRYNRPKRSGLKSWISTLHRQFISAKQKIKRDQTFRNLHFSNDSNLSTAAADYGPELIGSAIERYGHARISRVEKFA